MNLSLQEVHWHLGIPRGESRCGHGLSAYFVQLDCRVYSFRLL
jgi:hypothetical protein